ncbi:MAG: hypothetical protein HN842_11825 [Gammaproteobacteria bacterium]|nr:hypothetical protein [Chloroflexota bacterium]MBT7308897.1 hypothetical protein [Gammaproteobacteria bacterium]
MFMKKFTQQPNDVLDYDIDLSEWVATGDTITSTTASADTGLTVSVSNGTTTTPKIWCSGGADGTSYKVTVTVVTNDGRTKEIDFRLSVREE